MNEARDIVGISVPFAAGVAMGVALYPLLSGGLPFITSSILLVLICITTLLVRFGKLGDQSSSVPELVEVTGTTMTEISTETGIVLTGRLDSSSFSNALLRFRYSLAPG